MAQWVQTDGPEGGYVHSVTVDDSYVYAATFGPIFRMEKSNPVWVPYLPDKEWVLTARSLEISGTTLVAGVDGGGVFRSKDHGVTWAHWVSGLHQTSNVFSFAVSGNDLFAGTDRGVYRSNDRGANWTPTNIGQDSLLVLSLLVKDSVLLAGTGGGGVYRSTDYGESWAEANDGMTSEVICSLALLDTVILAGTWWTDTVGVFISTDYGTTWEPIQQPPIWNPDVNTLAIFDTLIFAGTHGGMFVSADSGKNWTPLENDPGSIVNCFQVDKTDIYAGTFGGVYVSPDTGDSWSNINNGLIATRIMAFARNDTWLFASTESSGLFRSNDDGTTWIRTQGLSNFNSLLSIGTDLYAGVGEMVCRSTDNGESWSMSQVSDIGKNNITALAEAGSNLFAGTSGSGVFYSPDKGVSWTSVNAGLSDTLIQCLAVRGTDLYAGTDNGVFFSADYGTGWTPFNSGLSDVKVQCLAVSRGNLFAGTENGGVYVSTIEGNNWTPVNTGLTDLNIRCLASGDSIVYTVTNDTRVYRSDNNGSSWHPFNAELINLPVNALDVSAKDLFAGTGGAGVWRLSLSDVGILDTAFLYALIDEGVDTNGDSLISYTEAEAVTSVDVSGKGISDMTGIEAFINLEHLQCRHNDITSLDVSSCTALKLLYCNSNQLTSLDVSNNSALGGLGCRDNQLISLDVSDNTLLTELYCHVNQLTSLNVSNCTALKDLVCSYNLLDNLDVSNNSALTNLQCGKGNLTSLDVSNNTTLTSLSCDRNQLTSLDVSNNTALTQLHCYENQLTSLDVSNNTALRDLRCGGNYLTSLNISKNIELLTGRAIKGTLDLSNMPTLYEVCVWEIPFPPPDRNGYVYTTGSPNVYFKDCVAPELVAIDPPYQPTTIEATSTEDGMIYLVHENTDDHLDSIRSTSIDSVSAIANIAVNIPLSGLDNGIYWLYATDLAGNISEREVFTIMGVGIDNALADQVRIYPNPANNHVTIETNMPGLHTIEITSLNGQLLYSDKIEGTSQQIDLSSFQKGVYFITIRSKDFVTTKKIIKY
jgi:photosystem II stability/assembly factor-like uncharacterized protein